MPHETEPLESRLAALLETRLRDPAAGGIAVLLGASSRPCVAWRPGSLSREPAFLVYSITKTFTSALALVLQEEGRLSLGDPLVRWFPEVPESARITIRALLNHTGRVPDYGGLQAYHDAVRHSSRAPWGFEEFARHTWRKGLLFEPGAGWAYSNPGYLLARRVLEAVAEESYADLVESRICRRLGLERTLVPDSVAALEGLAPAPSTVVSPAREPVDVRLSYHPGWVSHGVLASTPSEVARFLHALLSGQLVGGQAIHDLTALVPVPQARPHWRRASYGLGLMADPESPLGPLLGHNGGGPGYDASAFHAPRLAVGGATVCALCAVESGSLAEDLVRDTFALLDRTVPRDVLEPNE